MNFSEKANELSKKYDYEYGEIYDLMAVYMQFRLIKEKPISFLFNKKNCYERICNTTSRYVRLQNYKNIHQK